ncbi:uncharacterized protein LOC134467739 [Engraulis encrasicolus]|uniref:uncharacterized protein LOC134447026 n=1 Tax=Engraulis encrasicolus TaxID=184585 RepID=UPI002FCEF115
MDPPKLLVTVFMDEKEISKKVLRLRSLQEVVDACAPTTGTDSPDCYRVMKFDTDFNEFIDTDSTDSVEDKDKLQVFFRSSGTSVLAEQLNTSGAAAENVFAVTQNVAVPSGQQISACELDCEAVKNFLQTKDPRILAFYEEHGTLTEKWRRVLVTTTISYLVEKKGFYPNSADKQLLARAIVTLFPALQIKMEEENEGYEHFYDPVSHSGFLEDKLRNIRRSLRDDQRRYRRRGGSSEVLVRLEEVVESDESVKEWITVIKRMKPTPENRSSIKMGMDKTYTHRRYWISSQSPTLAEIVEHYPRFIDMPYLIDSEFARMFPDKADAFLRKWEPTIVPKLLKLACLEKKEDYTEDESAESSSFRALRMLVQYLPPTASGRSKGWTKCSVKAAMAYMLEIKPMGTSITSLLQTSGTVCDSSNQQTINQPRLVSLGYPNTGAQYVIVASNDAVAIPLQDESLACCLDKLFKLYWICNLAYPIQLASVFGFMEHVYGLQISGGKRAKIVELVAKLQVL